MVHSVPVACYASASVPHFEQAMLRAYHKQTLLYYTENRWKGGIDVYKKAVLKKTIQHTASEFEMY